MILKIYIIIKRIYDFFIDDTLKVQESSIPIFFVFVEYEKNIVHKITKVFIGCYQLCELTFEDQGWRWTCHSSPGVHLHFAAVNVIILLIFLPMLGCVDVILYFITGCHR